MAHIELFMISNYFCYKFNTISSTTDKRESSKAPKFPTSSEFYFKLLKTFYYCKNYSNQVILT